MRRCCALASPAIKVLAAPATATPPTTAARMKAIAAAIAVRMLITKVTTKTRTSSMPSRTWPKASPFDDNTPRAIAAIKMEPMIIWTGMAQAIWLMAAT